MQTNESQKNIPTEWQQVKLGDICNIFDGVHQTPNYTENGVPFYSVEHVTSGNFSDTKFVSEEIYEKESRRIKIEKGDILMTRIGDIGTTKYIDWNPKASFYVSLALIKSNKDVNSRFINFVINSNKFKDELRARTLTVAFPNKINLGDISKCDLLLPSSSEQNRIVSVLETWDNAIEKLSKKIDVKKQIKKGLMQDLLTGKKRLKGFSDKWEVKKLGELCDIGTGKKNNQDKVDSGKYPFFVRSPFVEKINTYSYDGEAILVPGEGNIGKIFHYINGKFDFHQRVYKISDFKKEVSGRFIYFYLVKNFSRATKSDSVKATVDSLRLPTFTGFKIYLPHIKEQNQIVEILTTADNEIQELEKKLQIIKDQKKYLLNNLITGTIRTPETLSAKPIK